MIFEYHNYRDDDIWNQNHQWKSVEAVLGVRGFFSFFFSEGFCAEKKESGMFKVFEYHVIAVEIK